MPSLAIILGAAAALVCGGAVVFVAARGSDEGPSHRYAPAAQETPVERSHPDERAHQDPSPIISSSLERLGLQKKLQWHMLQAGLLLRPSELASFMLGAGAAAFVAGIFLRGLPLAIAMGVGAAYLPLAYVAVRKSARRKALVNQLPEALSMMASSLRSGYSFLRAMQAVGDEMDPPIAEEFGRVLDELNVGVSHEFALKHLHERCPTGDIELVVTACQIQANVGGNLAEILDTTSDMIRERVRLQGEISALTAEGRLSAGILAALPVFLAVIVNHLSPGYLDPLFKTKLGLLMFGGASVAMTMGLLLIKKMLNIQI